jgi:hypothetical protein
MFVSAVVICAIKANFARKNIKSAPAYPFARAQMDYTQTTTNAGVEKIYVRVILVFVLRRKVDVQRGLSVHLWMEKTRTRAAGACVATRTATQT